MIELIPVLDGGAVDLRRHSARVNERTGIDRQKLTGGFDLARRLARNRALTATGKEAEILFEPADPFFDCPRYRGRDTARMPVAAEPTPKSLAPERLRQPPPPILRPEHAA